MDNVGAADGLIDRIVLSFDLLARHPKAGRARDELAAGLRSHVVGSYLIFYSLTPVGLDVVRVLTRRP